MSPANTEDMGKIARTNMVESQLRPNRVYNPAVLEAMLDLPRELFVPPALRAIAYADEALKVAPGRYLTEPLVTARLFEAALIEPGESVLVVGAGTGYSAAIAARIGARVVALEEHSELLATAADTARMLKLDGTIWYSGPLAQGCAEHAPYDAIVIDGSVPAIPAALSAQLGATGRLVAVVRGPGAASHIAVFEKAAGTLSRRITFDNVAPPLPGFDAKEAFEFS